MKPILILLTLFLVINSRAQDTIKVLFIGNSFTSQNDLPNLFSQLSKGSGKSVIIASYMPGGISVGDISQGNQAHMNNPIVYSLIKSNDWDYLVLQDNQGRFCLGYQHFSPSSLVIEGHLKIRDSLLYYHPCAHLIFFAGFGPKNGYPPYGNTGASLIDSIYHNYKYLNDTAKQILAPIGPAFLRIISNYSAIDLWGSDLTHPSLHGSFLTACVIYSTIFKSSPTQSPYNPGIATAEDLLLKNIAFQTTMDSINTTELAGITPNISQYGDTLSLFGYQNCNWFYNDTSILSSNCSIIINQSGNFYALATDSYGCTFRTLERTFYTIGINHNIKNIYDDIKIFPNPAKEFLIINSTQISEIEIFNIEGELVKKVICNGSETKISLANLSSGVYILKAKLPKGIVMKKFIKE
ncbi:MAG: hypothetical protein AUJ98_08840 [Bacteroidetes bacterium CG2_30_33_31]|nr:MAG: hypothetical protein AUJ98_08840 [Bacteroidetes bacterium CG2_30_33_31]